MKLRRLMAACVAGLMAVLASLTAVPQAEAQQRNVVMFGDSLLANPPFDFVDFVAPGYTTGVTVPPYGGCAKGVDRIGSELERRHGANVADFSCTGAGTFGWINNHTTLADQVNHALRVGKLTPDTSNVYIQIGINDTFKGPGLYHDQKRSYIANVGRQIDRIRHAAPNARVEMLGYPSVTGPNDSLCLIHFNQVDSNFPLPPVGEALRAVADWQRSVARVKNIGYFNLNAATRGHGQCAPRAQRWVTGTIDNQSTPYNITNHITHEGNRQIADIIARSW